MAPDSLLRRSFLCFFSLRLFSFLRFFARASEESDDEESEDGEAALLARVSIVWGRRRPGGRGARGLQSAGAHLLRLASGGASAVAPAASMFGVGSQCEQNTRPAEFAGAAPRGTTPYGTANRTHSE